MDPSSTSASQTVEKDKTSECQVCSEVAPLVLFKPCGHRVVCAVCSLRMKRCLHCKADITRKVTYKEHHLPKEEERERGSADNHTDTVSQLRAKLRELEDRCLCTICMERQSNVAFLCGHRACSECTDTLKSCHMCRGSISKKINLY